MTDTAPTHALPPKLGGREKAAILLLAVGEERAGEILRRLAEHEAEALSMQIATAPRVESATAHIVIEEAVASVLAADYLAEGGLEYARATLERAVGPERAADILERLTARLEKRPFEFLRHTPAEHLALFLAAEAPQTAALVIAHLHARLAGDVLTRLDQDVQADIARRVATMSDIAPEIARTLEEGIRQRLTTAVTQGSSTAGGTGTVAQILTSAGRTTERQVLDQLDTSDPGLAEEIRAQLFTFEDIAGLDDRAIQAVLRELDAKDLPLALRGAPDSVSERILTNMSQRGAEMLREEIAYQPPQRRHLIEQAQSRIIATVRRLEATDAITLNRSGDEELL